MIPDEMDARSMRKHILASIPVGPVIGALLAALSALISSVL